MINWFLNLNLTIQLSLTFVLGILLGILLMNFFLVVKNKKINLYQRK